MSDEATPGPEAYEFDGEGADGDVNESLKAAFDALEAENAGLKDQMLRIAAEAENTRRRAERESNDARAYAIQKFARDLLGVADNLQRALQHAPREDADPAVKNLVVGLDMTEKELVQAFERNGLKRVDPARGDKFDPNLHQAMMEQPADDVAGGAVLQVMQTGYELMGRIVRPAMVVVAAKGSGATATPKESGLDPYAGASDDAGSTLDTKA
jgi:molecular chaperone GrpE